MSGRFVYSYKLAPRNKEKTEKMNLAHKFEIGDYLQDCGSVKRVTEKAICVAINNGKWVGNKDNHKWIPKSAIIIHQAINKKGLLNDDTKHLIVFDFKNWFRL